MLKLNTKVLPPTVLALLVFATTAFAQPGYQWFNAAPMVAEGVDAVYFCEDGAPIAQEPTGFNEANGFFCCGQPVEHSIVASLTSDCSQPVAETSFTPASDKFYYITLAGNYDAENMAPNPDGEDTSLRFIITETDALHAAYPQGTEQVVYTTLAHLAPDAPNVTGIVQETGTVLNVGTFGTVTSLDVPFPSILGTVNIDVYPEAQLAAGDPSNPIMTVPLDLATGSAHAYMGAVTGYLSPAGNGGGPPLGVVTVQDDGVVEMVAGGAQGRTVTLWLNTATLPDTTSPSSLVEVRGCLAGCEDNMSDLPDGNVIAWDDRSTIEPTNDGGDYWHTSFMIPDDVELAFKFFSQQAEDAGIGGWEDGNNNWTIPAGTGDVDMGFHFFNKSGADRDYDYMPYESKPDSIAIWFRSYLNTEVAIQKGYDRETSEIGIRGDSASSGGALDWGITKVYLNPEGETANTPGLDLWSGVAYFPASAAGKTMASQPFKYFIEPDGWEDSADRTFTIPSQDTTLHWVYYSNSSVPSGEEPQTAYVIFSVDLTPMEQIGIFDLARGDTLEIRGSFNGWDCAGDGSPDDCLLDKVPGEPVFEGPVSPMTAFPASNQEYKFFLNLNDEAFMEEFGSETPSGWEEPITTTGANRRFVFEGDPNSDQILGPFFFNDVYPGNIVPGDGSAGSKTAASIDITFTVDMTAAVDDQAAPFNPATDTVTVEFGDPIWAFTQGVPGTVNDDGDYVAEISASFFSLPPAPSLGANMYQGTYTLVGPSYAAIQYKFAYTQEGGSASVEPGGSTADLGRRRTRYVPQNPDGSFPATWEFPAEVYQTTGVLPYEDNPAIETSVEQVGAELPKSIELGNNYPNPFNPSTTFEYSITNSEHVQVRVYDLTGQLVRTLVDGVQPAATYRVSFDAEGLASGVYIYQLTTPSRTISKKMLLLK